MGYIGPTDLVEHLKPDVDVGQHSLARIAAKRLGHISAGGFSTEVREKASLCLLDFLGAAQSGLSGPFSAHILKYASLRTGTPEAFCFGVDEAVCAETAALTNAMLAHDAARDDMHLDSCSHMGGIVVAAVLALSQRDGWSGEQIIRGLVGGYEMGAVLGTAIRGGGTYNKHLRASGLIGAFAAAAAAVTATNENEQTIINALSLAVNHACGINEWAWTGAKELVVQNGTASRAGITSYDLARCGVVSSESVLEGKDGLFAAVNAGAGAAGSFANWIGTSPLGRGILDVRFKPAPTCNFTQTSSALALKIARGHGLSIEDVERVTVTTTSAAIAYPGCDNGGPLRSAAQGKLSIQYGVSAALVFGRLDEETLARVDDEKVNAVMGRCVVVSDEAYDVSYKRGLQPAKVQVVLRDGSVLEESADDVPWLNGEEVKIRFLEEISPRMAPQIARSMLDRCLDLGNVDIKGDLLAV